MKHKLNLGELSLFLDEEICEDSSLQTKVFKRDLKQIKSDRKKVVKTEQLKSELKTKTNFN
jgi:hypothetical protein